MGAIYEENFIEYVCELLLPVIDVKVLGSNKHLNQPLAFATALDLVIVQFFSANRKGPVCFFFFLLETDEVNSEDSTEPPHKRLCLSEDDQSLDDSAPCISVVAVPSKLF